MKRQSATALPFEHGLTKWWVAFAAIWLGVNAGWPTTLILEPAKDNSIYSEADTSNGQGISLFAGRTKGSMGTDTRRALLQFDLSGQIPNGAVIESASLRLFVSQIPQEDAGDYVFSLHRLTRDWGEGASDAGDVGGRGAAAQAGDTTWSMAFFPDVAWTSPGGDFLPGPSASEILSGKGAYTWSGEGLTADIITWLEAPDSNFGWILLGPEEPGSARRFDSRHYPDPRFRPMLTIEYSLTWAGYPVHSDGHSVDTGEFLGWLDITVTPWVYVYALGKFAFLPEENVAPGGGWIWIGQ